MRIEPLIGNTQPAPAMQLAALVLSFLGIAAATLVGQLIALRWGTGPVVLLYLLPVLVAAIYAGLWPSLLAAVAGTLAYNFFFTAPVHTLFISSPASAVTVLILFVVGIVTSSLAASLRQQALAAAGHAARNATIAGFARQLLSCIDEQAIYEITVREVGRLFECNAVILAGADAPATVASAPPEDALSPADLAVAAQVIATGKPAGRGVDRAPNLGDWQFHPVHTADGVDAALGLARDDGSPPLAASQWQLLDNLLDQASLAIARARADGEARRLATLRERDGMRDALLASVGRDIKPSLNAIASASRALKREAKGDKAALATVAAEAVRLDRYVESLGELVPETIEQPLVVGEVAIDLYRRMVSKGGEMVHLAPKEYAVLAELAKHAGRVLSHAQLLAAVWGPAQRDQVDYLRVAIGALRRKLEDDPASPVLILNEPAVGYRLVTR